MTDPVRQIAEAVLYEGYLLWPYRRSAMKNQHRFTFGGIYPAGWEEDRSAMQVQCLVEGNDPDLDVRVRFLHVVERRLLDAAGQPVDELVSGGERYLSWEEAVEREAAPGPLSIAAGSVEEPLDGGTIVRSWEALEGRVDVARGPLRSGLWRMTVRVENRVRWDGQPRPQALRRTFCSTHAVLRVRRGAFVSLTDPPQRFAEEAEACVNDGAWPVLVGAPGERDTMLASPIILPDYPSVAPESPGDLFDGGEIDALLVHSIRGLTDAEREEMRATDPRAREILDRSLALGPERLLDLYGAVREMRPLED